MGWSMFLCLCLTPPYGLRWNSVPNVSQLCLFHSGKAAPGSDSRHAAMSSFPYMNWARLRMKWTKQIFLSSWLLAYPHAFAGRINVATAYWWRRFVSSCIRFTRWFLCEMIWHVFLIPSGEWASSARNSFTIPYSTINFQLLFTTTTTGDECIDNDWCKLLSWSWICVM